MAVSKILTNVQHIDLISYICVKANSVPKKTKVGALYQVLQEFYITVTAKLQPGLDPENARKDVRALLAWRPIVVNDRVLENAWLIQDRCQISWWDSLVVSAAQLADCRYLLTEDLQADQEFGSLRVTNPFHVDPASLMALLHVSHFEH